MEDSKTAPRQQFQESYPYENYAHARYEVAKSGKPGAKIRIKHY